MENNNSTRWLKKISLKFGLFKLFLVKIEDLFFKELQTHSSLKIFSFSFQIIQDKQ